METVDGRTRELAKIFAGKHLDLRLRTNKHFTPKNHRTLGYYYCDECIVIGLRWMESNASRIQQQRLQLHPVSVLPVREDDEDQQWTGWILFASDYRAVP
jgi:hypothetical protein